MAYLLGALAVERGSHLTGVRRQGTPGGASAVVAQLISLGAGQDADVEADFLCAHLPLCLAGLQGSDPHGTPWVLLLQAGPDAAATLLGTDNVFWAMTDATDRALQYNREGQVIRERGWRQADLLEIYGRAGVEPDQVADWTVAELGLGLVAECCYVPLTQIVAGKAQGCAFPNLDHECTHEVFSDVFAMWTNAHGGPDESALIDADDYLLGWDGPAPSYAAPAADAKVLYYWPESDLKKMSTKELRKLAARCKWGKRKTGSLKRKELTKMLSTPNVRNKGKGALEASGT